MLKDSVYIYGKRLLLGKVFFLIPFLFATKRVAMTMTLDFISIFVVQSLETNVALYLCSICSWVEKVFPLWKGKRFFEFWIQIFKILNCDLEKNFRNQAMRNFVEQFLILESFFFKFFTFSINLKSNFANVDFIIRTSVPINL